ncbi:hypothetical protein SCHPADRAFT_405663 [Schizopora paradoxa]|uniref:Ig-like domain-containing protein n=1 Tax=Schizopora paradoxa TaxID=27342 RepID=A0A0H2RKZ7_9AGAM|nr:hypothetical protein SCHPADRAFT_405663 [Schizopora paradoxa]
MGAFLFVGVLLLLAHHFLYVHLDGKPIDAQVFAVSGLSLRNQSVSSILGNAIAYAARTVLSAVIGVAFIQVLWLKLRRSQFSVKELDAVVACKGDPLAFSALPAWYTAFWLAVIALLAALMSVISIVTPGALRVESFQFAFPDECSINTVSLTNSNLASVVTNSSENSTIFLGAQANLMALTVQVLTGGSALQPPNPCPPGSACQYNIDFNAPAAVCDPVDSSFNLTEWLPLPDNDTAPILVWNSSSDGLWLAVARKDLATNSSSAVNCSMFNATHHALLTHTNTSSSTVEVYQTDFHNEISAIFTSTSGSGSPSTDEYEEMQFDAIITSFVNFLSGDVGYNHVTQEYDPFDDIENLHVAYSPLFSSPAPSSDVPWTSAVDLTTVLPSLMRNISVSLLTDRFSSGGKTSVTPLNTTCWYSSSAYVYNRPRLLATYGAALGVAAACMLFGIRAIQLNGVEESNAFSRILGAVLNKSLFDDRHELSASSKLTANGSPDGQLVLAQLSTFNFTVHVLRQSLKFHGHSGSTSFLSVLI